MKYYELNDVKKTLKTMGINFEEVRVNGAVFIYVNGLMQIDSPSNELRSRFWPEVRISCHKPDNYYVKACGAIYENCSVKKVIRLILDWI